MAIIEIKTTKEEQDKVLIAIEALSGLVVPMNRIAQESGVGTNRVRYVVVDLLDSKQIYRVPVKAFNKHYVRYKYFVGQPPTAVE